jgi:predicted nucleic acid-binding protein
MAEALCLADSNILIRWVQPGNPDHSAITTALHILVGRGVLLCYTSQNLGEFWNACTRPASSNGFGMSPEETDRKAKFFETRIRLLPDSARMHEEWRRLLVVHRVSGAQVHDARLVAAMNVYGAKQILTFNTKDFTRFKGIEALHPSEVR